MRHLPSGTVTMLFTDIESSTRLLRELGRKRYVEALGAHRRLLREAFTANGGFEVEMQGDSFHFAFHTAQEGVDAAVAAQRALVTFDWPVEPIRVRMGLHTGAPILNDGLYAGLDVHLVARIMAAGHGGQILLSQPTAELLFAERAAGTNAPTADRAGGVALRDLGEHLLRDFPASQRLWQLCAAGLDAEFPPLKTLDNRPTNLPATASALVGRGEETADLVELLTGDARLVTITGTGGTGKTRIAIEVARQLVEAFPDGVHWVPLAGLRKADLVMPAITQTLAARDDLSAYLQHRQLLLVLDNFEHVLAACAAVSDLLGAAPNLKVLATSRSPLRLIAERVYTLDQLAIADAETLFADRAQAAGARIAPNATVRRICERLDCLPLALELAAARTTLLDPETLLARLERSLALLTHGAADAPERQQTLRATIEWSYDLLSNQARTLLRRLSVFAGGFSLDAAEQVADAELAELAELVNLNLLKQRPGGRFLMLETIREYAAEQLEHASETHERRRRHAEFFLILAETAEPELRASGQEHWLRRLDADYDNIRVALGWAVGGDPHVGARLAAALGRYWYLHSMTKEGRGWIHDNLVEVGRFEPAIAARLVRAACHLAGLAGEVDECRKLAEESLALWEQSGDASGVAEALSDVGWAANMAGDLQRSAEFIERSRQVAEEAGDRTVFALSTVNLADVEIQRGSYKRARILAQEAATIARELNISDLRAMALVNDGLAAYYEGDVRASVVTLREAAGIARGLGGDYLCQVFEALAATLARLGEALAAGTLIGAAQAIRTRTGSVEQPFFAAMNLATVAAIHQALGDQAEAAFAQGRGMELNKAVDFALGTGKGLPARTQAGQAATA